MRNPPRCAERLRTVRENVAVQPEQGTFLHSFPPGPPEMAILTGQLTAWRHAAATSKLMWTGGASSSLRIARLYAALAAGEIGRYGPGVNEHGESPLSR